MADKEKNENERYYKAALKDVVKHGATPNPKEQTLSVDDQFLKDFLAKGGKAETVSGTPVDEGNVDALLEEAGSSGGTPKQAALHQKAVGKGMADTTKEDADKALKEQERNERLRAQELRKQRGKAIDVASKISSGVQTSVIDPVISKAGNAADRIASLRTIGGIGLLLVILVFLLFVVVQVNSAGDTRIKQWWFMLNGRAHLQGRQTVGPGGQPSSSTAPSTPSVTTINTPGGYVPAIPDISFGDSYHTGGG